MSQYHSDVYNIWAHMRQRCYNPKTQNYYLYGGRGITVCEHWRSAKAFIEDMGPRPSKKHTLDRIDGEGHYTPENCRWADGETQGNNRANNMMITAFGETLTTAQWVRKTGLTRDMIVHRIDIMGMTPEQAFSAERMSWNQREVIQMDLMGNEIRRYKTLAETHKIYGKGVFNAVSGRSKTAYGYTWKYAPLPEKSTSPEDL